MNEYTTPKEVYDTKFPDLTLWELFYGKKSDWYDVKEGYQDWSRRKGEVELFWEAVRKMKMNRQDFDFSYFVFPEFLEHSFWPNGLNKSFSKKTDFHGAEFYGKVLLWDVKFIETTTFYDTKFFYYVEFLGVEFWEELDFNSAELSGGVIFESVQFKICKFSKTRFYGNEPCLFQDGIISDKIIFEDVIFPDSVQFQRFDISRVEFQSCDFVKANFSNCQFKRANMGRIIMNNDNNGNYRDLSNMYRQLKRNRMEAKDWGDAGDAYRSEMVMTRKMFWHDFKEPPWKFNLLVKKFNLLVNLLIRGFYEIGSGYQQSMIMPIIWLALLIFGIPLITMENVSCYTESLKDSINAAIPLVGKIPEDTEHFFLYATERLLSVVLIAFFVLATRARLRQ